MQDLILNNQSMHVATFEITADSCTPKFKVGMKVLGVEVPEAEWGLQASGLFAIAIAGFDCTIVKHIKQNNLLEQDELIVNSSRSLKDGIILTTADIEKMWCLATALSTNIE